ncbi:MAG: hypothetical protein ABIQ35_04565, partial [Verrucomicrobiota bacterium]
MKTNRRLIHCIAGMMAITALTARVQGAVTLPSSAALPTNSVSNRGFTVRTAQASATNIVANSLIRASRQINGILTDAGGITISNLAFPGPQSGGAYFQNFVSFERDAVPIEPKDTDGIPVGTGFTTDLFPGIPGQEGETTQFADESVALLVLDPGVYTLAISANADRTDANDDDGVAIYVGANPRDFFATKIGEFKRTTGTAPFSGNQYIENQIEVVVPVRGAYPFRLLHWQQGLGANLLFYLVDTNTTARYLINDTTQSTTPLAYRSSTNAVFNSPYIADIVPSPGSAGNGSAAQIVVTLFDGTATVNTGNVQLSVNGVTVIPQTLSKIGNKTTIKYAPNGNWASANNAVRLVYADSNAAFYTNSWAFAVNVAGGSSTQVAGQWDFDFGNLGATVGNPLQYINPAYDNGGTGSNPNQTTFGTTTSFGIPDINGQVANVMQVPGDTGPGSRNLGYIMTHGIAPNGGGTKVNQYTLIMDVMVNDSGTGAASLINIGASLDNTDDGDLFWQGNNFGQGSGGYNGTGAFTPKVWHRVVAA